MQQSSYNFFTQHLTSSPSPEFGVSFVPSSRNHNNTSPISSSSNIGNINNVINMNSIIINNHQQEREQEVITSSIPFVSTQKNQTPYLTMSSNRILKFKPFTIQIIMGKDYSSKFSPCDVMRAGLSAKCRTEDDQITNIPSCFCTGGKRIVEIGISNKESFGPHISEDGLVTFTFDSCKCYCSSSRDHHKSRLVIAVDDLPNERTIFTPPFVLQAREKQIKKKHQSTGTVADTTTANTNTNANNSELIRRQPSGSLSSTSDEIDMIPPQKRHKNENTLSTLAPLNGVVQDEIITNGARRLTEENFGQDIPRCLSSLLGFRLMIRVHTSMATPDALGTIAGTFANSLQSMSGFRDYRWKTATLNRAMLTLITFSFFDNEDSTLTSLSLVQKYLKNESPVENPYHCDLNTNNMCCLISYCTNW